MTAVQRLDVALHGPLEVRLAGRGSRGRPDGADGTQNEGWRRGPGGDGDGHLNRREAAHTVVGDHRYHVRWLVGGIQQGPIANGDLGGVLLDFEFG